MHINLLGCCASRLLSHLLYEPATRVVICLCATLQTLRSVGTRSKLMPHYLATSHSHGTLLVDFPFIPSFHSLVSCPPVRPDEGSNYQDLLAELTGQKTVPNVFVNKTHVGGCEKTMQVEP